MPLSSPPSPDPRYTPSSDGSSPTDHGDTRPLLNAELVQLQIRVIALENLVISLLAAQSNPDLDAARDMADYILPRPGSTQHRLTINAAAQMTHLVERARIFRDSPPGN